MNRDRVLIIAEAGVNHNGDIKKALELVKVAEEAGADFVKFQTFKTDRLVSIRAQKAAYQIKNSDADNRKNSQHSMLKLLELSDSDHRIIIDECKNNGIRFLSTAFDLESIDFLNSLDLPLFKIPSGEITNYPYLKRLAQIKKPVILSTGMAEMEEIGAALDVLMSEGLSKKNVTVLHCSTEYPAPMKEVNLKAMIHIAETFGVKAGYSDHTLGIEVSVAAVALGAKVIEKHFTLDRSLPGPDHKASLEPDELKEMVRAIRNVEKAISGSGIKEPGISELKNRNVVRKSLHAARDLKKGDVINAEDLISLRPGDGISPMKINELVGKTLAKNIKKLEKLNLADFQ